MASANSKALEGDWQYTSEKVIKSNQNRLKFSLLFVFHFQGWDPVKMTVKQMMGQDWMVACMIPKGL